MLNCIEIEFDFIINKINKQYNLSIIVFYSVVIGGSSSCVITFDTGVCVVVFSGTATLPLVASHSIGSGDLPNMEKSVLRSST